MDNLHPFPTGSRNVHLGKHNPPPENYLSLFILTVHLESWGDDEVYVYPGFNPEDYYDDQVSSDFDSYNYIFMPHIVLRSLHF